MLQKICDVLLLVDDFIRFVKVSFETWHINPFYFVSLPNYAYQCSFKNSNFWIVFLKSDKLFLPVKNAERGSFSGVCGPLYVKRIEEKV